jgi:HamA
MPQVAPRLPRAQELLQTHLHRLQSSSCSKYARSAILTLVKIDLEEVLAVTVVMFEEWCDINEEEQSRRKTLCRLTEKADGREAVMADLVDTVRSHYDNLEQIAADVERLGFPGASAILRERLPQTRRARSGEIGEILATEFIESHTEFHVSVRRLRYKDGREMALRGDDFLGVGDDDQHRLVLLKGESKSRNAMSGAAGRSQCANVDARRIGSSALRLSRKRHPGRNARLGTS